MVAPSYPGKPHPIGYIEAQTAWVGLISMSELEKAIDGLRAKTLRENPGMVPCGGRLEEAFDGAGVAHYHLYLGFAPLHESSEPLDPHNMNDAPLPQPGMMQPTDISLPLGWKEEKFNRGT